MLMQVLPKYGAAAKPYLPRLREMGVKGRFEKKWNEMLKAIEDAQGSGDMLRLADIVKKPPTP